VLFIQDTYYKDANNGKKFSSFLKELKNDLWAESDITFPENPRLEKRDRAIPEIVNSA